MERAETLLRENLPALHRLAQALLEREVLDGNDVERILRGEALPPLSSDGHARAAQPAPSASA
jgi:cell division protease FtsH